MPDNHRFDVLTSTVADSLSEPGDLEQTLVRISQTARDTVPGVDCASICVWHRQRGLETVAPTSPVINQANALQNELQEGPAYSDVADDDVIYSPDLPADERWPRYGRALAGLGLLCQLAIGIAHPTEAHATLNLYSRSRNAFEDFGLLGDVFSSQAKIALRYAQEVRSLTRALTLGTTVARATGVVMERQSVTAETALQFVNDLARSEHLDLLAAAEAILEPDPTSEGKP